MSPQLSLRGKNALVAGGAALIGLAAVSCWLGAPLAFLSFPLWTLAACLLGLVVGSLLLATQVRWSILVGGGIGVITGAGLAWRVMSEI
jgi:hypothetical protein